VNQPNCDRKDQVLEAVIRSYVGTARPVGSHSLAEGLNVSSATIRNVFSELEKTGYLTHPHTSAGRIPTDQGYRLYVDKLLKARRLTLKEKQAIEREYRRGRAEVEALLRQTARILSAMTRLAGVALYRAPGESTLDHFKVVPVSPRKVIVLLVLGDVWVEQELVHLEDVLQPREVSHIAQLLNRRFAGWPLARIREEMLLELERARADRLAILQAVMDLLDGALGTRPDHVIVEGAPQLLEQPEFRGPEAMENVLSVAEDKGALARALGRRWGQPGLKIDIGREMRNERLKDCSFVQVPCRLWGNTVGTLGVLGPTRMAYDRVTGLLEHVSLVLDHTLLPVEPSHG
jgi:heat-inducible transcriptional repressor